MEATAATPGWGGGSPLRSGAGLPLPSGSSLSPSYLQLALYLAANALTIVIGLLIWNLNTVLADFRDSMLYALLCSVALRPAKDALVAHMDRSLADSRRSIGGALLALAALPLTALWDAYDEGRTVLTKWRQAVAEELSRRQAQLKHRGELAGGAAATPASPRTPRSAAASAAANAPRTAMQTMPSLAVYGHAAVRVLKSRRTTKKRRKQRQAKQRGGAPEGSAVLFRWLFRICAAWLLWEWVRDSWSATVQLVLLVFTSLVVLGLVPLLLLTTNRLSSAMFSPIKTPTASVQQTTAEGHKRRSGLQSLSPPKRPCFTPFTEGRQRPAASPADDASSAAGEQGGTAAVWEQCRTAWRTARAAACGVLGGLEAGLRSTLRANLHALVALLLILGLFVGTTGLAAFLSVRVAQEGRATVLAVRDVFPAAWAGMAASTPLLADAVAAAGGGMGSSSSSNSSLGGRGSPAAPVLPSWVASYQKEALQLVQQSLPAIFTWGEAHFQGFVEKQNLTSALGDIRLLYETLQGPRQCAERERQKLLVALARAEVALQAATDAKAAARQQLAARRADLQQAVVRLEAARTPAEPARPAPAADCAAPADLSASPVADCKTEQEAGEEAAVPLRQQVRALEAAVVEADAAVQEAKAAHKAAVEVFDVAEREQRAAQSRLALCSAERHAEHHGSLLPGLAGEVGARLQRAYLQLWRRQFRGGVAEMRAAAALLVAAVRGVAQRSTGAVGDLGSLHRLAQAAADPLIAVGRVAGRLFAGSVGSTTAAALMGGLGVLRLGMGVVKFGMQLMLFLALLYYLLAAQSDPLLAAVGVLPLSEAGRQRTAVALNRALGGVLISAVKLIAFHGCFSWITFRVMALPLTYTASVASAACALLPFVPTYAVALPGCVVLLAQGRLLAAPAFFALHFMGYYIGDTVILEDIPGGHPYMLSLGILGGIYAFENPLQGCLLGPILLSLLSVFYNLHSEFMGGGERAADGRPQHRLWSLTPNASTAKPAGAGMATAGRAQQLERRPGGEGLASPERSVSLRINVPTRRGPPPAGPVGERGDHESQVTARDLQQRQQQQQERSPPSVSFELDGRHASLNALLHPALHSPPVSDGDEAEQEAADSNSGANSFSFLMGGAGKLHDD